MVRRGRFRGEFCDEYFLAEGLDAKHVFGNADRARAYARSILASDSGGVRRMFNGRLDNLDDAAIENALARAIMMHDLRIVQLERVPRVRLRRGIIDTPKAPGTPDPTPPKSSAEEAMFVLEDEAGAPVAGERFMVRFSDGTTREGRTDASGFARVSIPAGVTCEVTFPDREGSTWS